MRILLLKTVLVFGLIFSFTAIAATKTDDSLGNKNTEVRFRNLVKDIRCMVCQNQTLLDSKAPLAVDLRREILIMMDKGKSDKEIIDFLVKRYGDFILYNPPLKSSTMLLWFGPLLFLLIGLAGVVVLIVRRRHVADETITAAERSKLDKLLADSDKD